MNVWKVKRGEVVVSSKVMLLENLLKYGYNTTVSIIAQRPRLQSTFK